ncbi:MAG: hypothetical protein V4672_21505 [Verrucomicrobiota bacterium]
MPTPSVSPSIEALESRLAPAGVVALTLSGNTLSVSGDPGDNSVDISDNLDGTWTVKDLTDSGTQFLFQGVQQSVVTLTEATHIKANLQGGNDSLSFTSLRSSGSITVTDTAAGNDTVNFSDVFIGGAVKLDLGAGDDQFKFQNVNFASLLSVKGGAGNDVFESSTGWFQGITADFGSGGGKFILGGSTVFVFGSVNVTSQSVADETMETHFSGDSLRINGSVTLKTGHGESLLLINTTSSQNFQTLGNFTHTSGSAADSIYLAGSISIFGKMDIKAGNGDNLLATGQGPTSGSLSALTLGSFSYTGGTGNETVVFGSGEVDIHRDVIFTAGNSGPDSSDSLAFDSARLSIGGKLTYKGNNAADFLDLFSTVIQITGAISFTGANGTNSMNVTGDFTTLGALAYAGGTGHDSFNLIANGGPISILGNVTASLGTGDSDAFLRDTSIIGHLSITSATQQSTPAGTFELLKIVDSSILGRTTVKSIGTVDGEVLIHNSTFKGALTLDTGKGNDRVYLDTPTIDQGNTEAKNRFLSNVKIILGAGNDTLDLTPGASPTHQGNLFQASLLVDGGTGTNTALALTDPANIYAIPAILKNIG